MPSAVFDPYVLTGILVSAIYGLFVGRIPGLTATMATRLLVPITFFMPRRARGRGDRHRTQWQSFSWRHPWRAAAIPGTPASAAYTDEAYAMTLTGRPRSRSRGPVVLGGRRGCSARWG